ncbi:hypothetical protein O1R50_26045 [Glycomyces luteolus]|uniref:Uncharacterized protein n=1 Tax=Glycomyces luteolus TaxID=2670330 RepID=A0A9X3SSP0_9ACTN|nr:hypothetical protein [Glycomyces luteolus]MDA1363102.1 hypothetical protein [Glycomyces luteolus]
MVNEAHGKLGHPAVALVANALAELERGIKLVERPGPTSHTVLVGTGFETPSVTTALGRYLVGALANVVGLDARLSEELLAEWPNARAELDLDLLELLGPDNNFADPTAALTRDDTRNPWIAEGLLHALLVVRARTVTGLLPGTVHAIQDLHTNVKSPGIDLLAIYDDDVTAVMIGECKATKSNGTDNLRKAAHFFRKVDAGEYGRELRKSIGALRTVLPETLRPKVTNALWQNRRCYVPAIAFAEKFDPHKERQHLAELQPPPTHRRLISIELVDFEGFFDAVADAMRAAVVEVTF